MELLMSLMNLKYLFLQQCTVLVAPYNPMIEFCNLILNLKVILLLIDATRNVSYRLI